MRYRLAPVLLLALAQCGTTVLPLSYATPPGVAASGPAVVADVSGTDTRGESDPRWYGTIRGNYGNPLKTLDADRPIAEVAASAVRDGLAARGMTGRGGASPYDVRVTVRQFEADQVARREARISLTMEWLRRGTGQVAFTNSGQADLVGGSIVTLEIGIFGSTDELQSITARALSQAVDQALDDPALHRFLASSPA